MDEHVAQKLQVLLLLSPGFTLGFTILFQRVFDEEFQMQQDRIKRQRANAPVAFHAISASTAAAAAVAAADTDSLPPEADTGVPSRKLPDEGDDGAARAAL